MVKLLYADEHLNCPNYDNKAHPAIEEIVLEQDQIWDNKPRVSKVVFILKGEMEYSTGKVQGQHAQKGQILFFPVGKEVHCRSLSNVNMLVIRIYDRIQLCDCFRVEDLYLLEDDKGKRESAEVRDSLLDVNPVMEKYLDMLMLCYHKVFNCSPNKWIRQQKAQEAFHQINTSDMGFKQIQICSDSILCQPSFASSAGISE